MNHIEKYLFKSQSKSIDAWLAKDENNISVDTGKLLIAYFLSRSENDDFSKNGFFKPTLKPKSGSDNKKNWYKLLINSMYTDNFNDFGSTNKKLTIITFNYDRSLEYYLFNALKGMYPGHSDEQYFHRLSQIDIFHLYGNIGECLNEKSPNYVPYGINHSFKSDRERHEFFKELEARAKNIKLIPEAQSDIEFTKGLKNKLEDARYIYFIDFAYDKLNLEILGFTFQTKRQNVTMAGTVYGMQDGEIALAKIRTKIETARNSQVELKCIDNKCDAYKFFSTEVVRAFS